MLRSLFGFDRRQSKPHLELLSKFLEPRWTKSINDAPYWQQVLTEKPGVAMKRFQKEEILITGSLEDHLVAKYMAKELKALAKSSGLPVSGRKEEIARRLVEHDPTRAKDSVKGATVLRCSSDGATIAQTYVDGEKQQLAQAEQRALGLVIAGRLAEASLAVAGYEAERVFPRGMGIDWRHHDPSYDVSLLTEILKSRPRILGNLSGSQLGSLRLAACMMALFGVVDAGQWLPPEFKTALPFDNDVAARMMLFYGRSQDTLQGYRQSNVVIGVQILATKDSCDACRKLDGTKHTLGSVPELPNEHCTHPMGCRCAYLAITRSYDEITAPMRSRHQ